MVGVLQGAQQIAWQRQGSTQVIQVGERGVRHAGIRGRGGAPLESHRVFQPAARRASPAPAAPQ